MKRIIAFFMAAGAGLLASLTAHAAASTSPVLLSKYFELHDFDAPILSSMGYGTGSLLTYVQELASPTYEEKVLLKKYENVGCNPFYFLQEGKITEYGFNCRTFFCTGYLQGPKQCKDADGKAYNGAAEINRRLNAMKEVPRQKYFTEFTPEERTAAMDKRIKLLNAVRCHPFYLVEFRDVAVAEGYECEELGSYPKYSPANYCLHDWREDGGYVCDVEFDENEYAVRQNILGVGVQSAASSSTSRKSSSQSSVSSVSSAQSNSDAYLSFTVGEGSMARQPLNRGVWMKHLMLSLKHNLIGTENKCFPDVGFQDFAFAVCAAKKLQLVAGYSTGRFLPGASVNHAEALKMLLKAMDADMVATGPLPVDVLPDSWYAPYVRTAVSLGILAADEPFNPADPLTRAEAARWVAVE